MLFDVDVDVDVDAQHHRHQEVMSRGANIAQGGHYLNEEDDKVSDSMGLVLIAYRSYPSFPTWLVVESR